MASIGNSITDDTGSDAVPGGGSIIKLEVTPGNQFYLKYSIFTIAKINAPKIIWFFWNGKHSVIHKSGQALAMDAHRWSSLGVGHLLLSLCVTGDLGENTPFRHDTVSKLEKKTKTK